MGEVDLWVGGELGVVFSASSGFSSLCLFFFFRGEEKNPKNFWLSCRTKLTASETSCSVTSTSWQFSSIEGRVLVLPLVTQG